ncbi:MAG: tetraacyldisaccharide 4'-kinase [Candidatus Caenarcaniphilales bacterium]|nr:tetraacyldisaccharide 4'-kinase [Candidatus Caenarcaniphilales bacterium]
MVEAFKGSLGNKLPISAFIITLNEEENIKNCLESVSFCDEIIVVDSGSIDRTKQIALELGAEVIENEFENYRDQKQFALEQCTNEWVLSLDADERVEKKLYETISNLNLQDNQIDGYSIKRLHWFLGKWIYHSGLYPDYKLRFFKKSKGSFVGANIHEVVSVNGKVDNLNEHLLHYSWKNIQDFLITQIKYADKVAENKFSHGETASLLDILIKFKFSFFNKYFLRLGFLDRTTGFIVSLILAIATAYKYFRVWELNKKFKSDSFFQQSLIHKLFLKPFQKLYELISIARIYLYDKKILKKSKLSVPVISIGNLSVGGSGKTPFVIWLTKNLHSLDIKKIAILSRGYKSRQSPFNSKDQPKEVLINSNPKEVGDEPLLMKNALVNENVDVIVHSSRTKAGKYAVESLGSEVLLMDDGFQHYQLERDVNICLIDCSDPYFKDLLPIGSRRENFSELIRASVFVLTRTNHNHQLKEKYLQYIERYAPNKKIFELQDGVSKFTVGISPVEEYINGKKVLAFCGLGNPTQFFKELESNGIILQKTISFQDHYDYKQKDVELLKEQLSNCEADYLVTTSKDAIKLYALNISLDKLIIAHHEIKSIKLLGEKIDSNSLKDHIHTQLSNLLGLELFTNLTNKEAEKIG